MHQVLHFLFFHTLIHQASNSCFFAHVVNQVSNSLFLCNSDASDIEFVDFYTFGVSGVEFVLNKYVLDASGIKFVIFCITGVPPKGSASYIFIQAY
jgi:galactitol-specific phosphotransferase system IIC component